MKIVINNREIINYEILKFNIEGEISKHTKLEINLEMLSDIKLNYKDDIRIYEDNISIFNGKVYNYKLKEYGIKGYNLNIIAYSYSKILDEYSKSRIYQDVDLTYKEILEDILLKYNLKYHISKSLNKKINRIYFQDDVTDFEFIKRILSNIKEGIFNSYNGLIVFGFDDISNNELKNIEEKIISEKGISYTLVNTSILVSDKIDNKYVIYSKITYEKAILINYILLSNKNENIKMKLPNIKGRFIEAKVVDVIKDKGIAKMKVDFSISMGEDKSINKKLFSFATPYSRVMTGMYVSPCISDIVDVYFPSNYEDDAKVAFCINNRNSDRFVNNNIRNFFTDNVNIEIDKDKIEIRSNHINLLSIKSFNILSNSYFAIESKDDASIYGENILIVSKKNDIEINSNKNLLLKGIKIHNN